ncbi:Predicted arabinose efflux permease, MFS family [Micromonospora echinospora]|uniref:Predicted arabinose efflux permease, MFS family n=1 Tax=Micromonospora echinospora TaxID=1877 RepID=A0A1C4YN32_MICEC|nr:Predicted arabinose efflux permease, MFS family [Micromonospora echinospora]
MGGPAGADQSWGDLRLVATAHAVSTFGSFLNLVALGLFVLHLTGSPVQTGVFMAVRLAAGFLTGPVAGRLAARHRRPYLMIGADLLAAGMLVLLVTVPAGARTPVLYGLAVALGAGQTLWGVAMRAHLPTMVGADRLTRANGLVVTLRSVGMLLGFASAGVLVGWLGYHVAFLVDAATYLLSALLLLPVARRTPAADRPAPTTGRTTVAGRAPGRFGLLRAVAPVVPAMIAVRAADAFGSASHNVGLPVYATLVRPDSPATFAATFTTAWAAGSLLAGRWAARRAKRSGRGPTELPFGVATCLMSVCFVLAFTGLPVWLLVPVTLAAGAADGYAEISYTTRLQAVDADLRPRLFGFASAAQNAGFGLGMIVCAALLDRFPPLPVVGAAHGLALAVALVFLVAHVRLRTAARRQPAEVAP